MERGLYTGTIFHRILPGAYIQVPAGQVPVGLRRARLPLVGQGSHRMTHS